MWDALYILLKNLSQIFSMKHSLTYKYLWERKYSIKTHYPPYKISLRVIEYKIDHILQCVVLFLKWPLVAQTMGERKNHLKLVEMVSGIVAPRSDLTLCFLKGMETVLYFGINPYFGKRAFYFRIKTIIDCLGNTSFIKAYLAQGMAVESRLSSWTFPFGSCKCVISKCYVLYVAKF